ncbi:MAG: hypothetical protein RLZZ210_874 [Pseudomonadota bacterium]|jgi:hypothetical protein
MPGLIISNTKHCSSIGCTNVATTTVVSNGFKLIDEPLDNDGTHCIYADTHLKNGQGDLTQYHRGICSAEFCDDCSSLVKSELTRIGGDV